ncbi:thiamine-phosphate diphosphorylase [Desulfuribacillus stibiiarsenatis]|uniref:Thiamine-phosphate synthase n=1 Tax=Desulfuribacillus stibiiarsenatis TaxID=1390249 RepID=A0A1E5L8D1_9FIRM|nr:thiamine phosphate synthase [Desulfuribacillus stibiiarsenatis]OEH86203.1 thiamine-phosphate diphosphorylase [Desulfuribacillus stibiiarsenatis]
MKSRNDARQLLRSLFSDIYCITSEEHSQGRSNISVVQEMIDSGIRIIQYREKDKKALYKYQECVAIREMTKAAGVTFIINDDIDLAIAIGADGVHIGQEDLPLPIVRQLVGSDMFIGLSTHAPEQAIQALELGADYIGVGPIYKTFTKKDVCEPVGLEYLDFVVKHIDIPFVAIGGIKEHNIQQVKERGANCFCLVTEIVGAANISHTIQQIRKRIQSV